MKSVALCALLLAVSSGCASYPRIAGQDEAEQLIWRDIYGEESAPPPVEWIYWGESIPGNPTAIGFTLAGWKVQVMVGCDASTHRPLWDEPITNSKLAHELMHYRTWLHTGDVDPLHNRGDWQLVEAADSELHERKL